jgi:hypothetical protein
MGLPQHTHESITAMRCERIEWFDALYFVNGYKMGLQQQQCQGNMQLKLSTTCDTACDESKLSHMTFTHATVACCTKF